MVGLTVQAFLLICLLLPVALVGLYRGRAEAARKRRIGWCCALACCKSGIL